jgi:hypothetical protein
MKWIKTFLAVLAIAVTCAVLLKIYDDHVHQCSSTRRGECDNAPMAD